MSIVAISNHHDAIAVSCLMVTQHDPARFAHFQKSVNAYIAQTYCDKELIIVIDPPRNRPPDQLTTYLTSLNRPDIEIILAPGPATLGRLRNIAREAARGEIICQWDDDDLCHPARLATQVSTLLESGRDAVFLQDVLQYVPPRRAIYWTSWRATPLGGHPGTLMARRTAVTEYPETGELACRGEDLHVALVLKNRGRVTHLAGAPHLFIYVSHGTNTWSASHHEMLICSLAISRALLARREAILRTALAPFGFPAGQIELCGINGPAFTL